MWALSLLLGLLVVLAITAATGYFVAQEFAYTLTYRAGGLPAPANRASADAGHDRTARLLVRRGCAAAAASTRPRQQP